MFDMPLTRRYNRKGEHHNQANHSSMFCDGVTYTIDWNTGLTTFKVSGQSPIFCEAFINYDLVDPRRTNQLTNNYPFDNMFTRKSGYKVKRLR